jgi:hypothetical protein
MADLSTQQIFNNGDLVTAESLNNIMSTSSVLPDVISGKSEKASVVGGDDFTLLFDSSSATLKKAKVNSIRNATGDTTLPSSLFVKNGVGGPSVFSVASTSGNTAIAGTLGVAGNTTMVGTLNVADRVTLAIPPIVTAALPSLAVFTDENKALTSVNVTGSGSVVMSAGPTITGTATIAKTAIGGATIGTNSLAVTGTSSLADTTIAGTATATKVAVGGATVGTNALAVTGAVGVTGNASISGSLTVPSATVTNLSTTNNLSVVGTSALATLAVNGGTLTGGWKLSVNGDTQIAGGVLNVLGTSGFYSPVLVSATITDNGLPVSAIISNSTVAGRSNGLSIKTSGNSDSDYALKIIDSGSATDFLVTGTGKVCIGTGTPTTSILTVAGNTTMTGSLLLNGNSIGSNGLGTRTVTTTTTTPTGGADGDIVFVI